MKHLKAEEIKWKCLQNNIPASLLRILYNLNKTILDPKASREEGSETAAQSDTEALIDPADNSEEFLDHCEDYPDYNRDYSDSERDSYLERMSGSHTESFDGGRGLQGPYLGSYQRIRRVTVVNYFEL